MVANLVALINMILLSIFNTPKLFYICSALNGFSLGKWLLLPEKLQSKSVIISFKSGICWIQDGCNHSNCWNGESAFIYCIGTTDCDRSKFSRPKTVCYTRRVFKLMLPTLWFPSQSCRGRYKVGNILKILPRWIFFKSICYLLSWRCCWNYCVS